MIPLWPSVLAMNQSTKPSRYPSFQEEAASYQNLVTRPYAKIIHGPYRIIYRLRHGSGQLHILRFWHAARGEPFF